MAQKLFDHINAITTIQDPEYFDKLSDEYKKTNQIFNIAEARVMEFISKFLDEHPNIVFIDEIPKYVEPLILLPFADYFLPCDEFLSTSLLSLCFEY